MGMFSQIKGLAREMTKTLKGGSGGSSLRKRAPEHKIVRWREKKQTLFGVRPHITRKELQKTFEKLPDNIPHIGKFSKEERLKIIEELYPQKEVGTFVTPSEYNRGIRMLKKALRRTGNLRKRQEIRTKIKFLQHLKGEQNEK